MSPAAAPQGLIRHFRGEMEERIKSAGVKKPQQIAAHA